MTDCESVDARDTHAVDSSIEDSDNSSFDTATVECYRRRSQLLSGTHAAEWWMAVGVLLIIAGVGLVIL